MMTDINSKRQQIETAFDQMAKTPTSWFRWERLFEAMQADLSAVTPEDAVRVVTSSAQQGPCCMISALWVPLLRRVNPNDPTGRLAQESLASLKSYDDMRVQQFAKRLEKRAAWAQRIRSQLRP